MGAGQGESRRGMVESWDFVPRTHDMAGFAASSEPACFGVHSVGELSLMRIDVASLATVIGEVVRSHVASVREDFMAIAATDRGVASLQGELALAMPGQGERRRREAIHGVAILATVLMGRAGELVLVRVNVAVHAALELDLILCGFAGRAVAFLAGHGGMLSEKGIPALGVGRDRIGGWLPTVYVVAARAFALVGPLDELATVHVLVAVFAQLVRNRNFEIGGLMALRARHCGMLAQQRELGLGMIKRRGRRTGYRLPCALVVA